MSTTVAHPAVEHAESDERRVTNRDVAHLREGNYGRFADSYGLDHRFLPFPSRAWDPVRVCCVLTPYLNGRPRSAARVAHTHLSTVLEAETSLMTANKPPMKTFCLLSGWWAERDSSRGIHYANPRNPHQDTLTSVADWNRRKRLLKTATSLGVVDPTTVAPALGHSGTTNPGRDVIKTAERAGVPWAANREKGRKTIARTWKTLSEWGYTHSTLGDAFGVHQSTISRGITDVSEFEPPLNPAEYMQEVSD